MSEAEDLPNSGSAARPLGGGSSNFYVLVFGAFMLVGLLLLAWIGRPPRSTAIGESLPRLDLRPLAFVDEPAVTADLEGKISVLHFWGTWCPPCREEFPEFVKLSNKFSNVDKVKILSVSCSGGPEYDLEKLKVQTLAFLEEYSATMPTYADSAAMTRQGIAMLLPNGSFGYPTTLLVGPDGKIIDAVEGYRPGEMERLAKEIESLL